jgi:peptidoglycan/LPS O-acetylase OafA/YrhL
VASDLTPADQLEHGERATSLDGVRGIASLMVLVHHCGRGAGSSVATKVFSRVSAAGWIGVDLFFVLSGFLITGLLLEARGRPAGLKRFWFRRALRILPLAYAFLALVFFSPIWRQESWHSALSSQQAWFWLYANNWLSLWQPGLDHGVLGHFWSLAIEEQFYLVWPFAVLLLRPRHLARLCLMGVAASLLGHVVLAEYGVSTDVICSLTPIRLDGLLAGAWLATRRYTRHPGMPARGAHRAPLAAAGVISVLLIWPARGLPAGNRWVMSFAFSGLALIFSLFLAGILSARAGSVVRRSCEARPLAFLGRISYGFYVLHMPVIGFLRKHWAPAGSLADCLGFFAAALLISALLATVSWIGFERPILRLSASGALAFAK